MRIYTAILNRFPNTDEKFIVHNTSAFLGLYEYELNSNLKLRRAFIASSAFFITLSLN